MEGKRLIHSIVLRNFLSYGESGVAIQLEPLNVLIGPNASGKSNLIEALATLRALPRDLAGHFRAGGGVTEYIWKGGAPYSAVWIGAEVNVDMFPVNMLLNYRVVFAPIGQYVYMVDEEVGFVDSSDGMEESVYRIDKGTPVIKVRSPYAGATTRSERVDRRLEATELKRDQSVLSQIRDLYQYPELTHLASSVEAISIYQEWSFGQKNSSRLAQGADMPSDRLLPDGSNLGLVLHELMQRVATRTKLLGYLQRFYEAAQFISTRIYGGTVQLFIEERGGGLIPATRLSDGTLRYLALLSILCHPTPPPLICIEEPELGLHPDVIPTIAELLKEACQRTQLVVTTHSDALVSALSDVPEAVIVCEPRPEGTSLRRLSREGLTAWLEDYTLGEVWRMGEIGGNRW